MAEEVEGLNQWDLGGQSDDNDESGEGEDEQQDDNRERRRRPKKKKKSQQKKDKSQKPKKSASSKQAKAQKSAYNKQLGQGIKKSGQKLAQKQAGKIAGQATSKGASAAGRGAIQAQLRAAQQAVARMLSQIAQAVARVAAQIAQQAAAAAQALLSALAAVAWPLIIILLIIIIVAMLILSFLGGRNEILSMAGGSEFIAANYNNPDHRAIVTDLISKTQGTNPSLVIYDAGKSDIEWKQSVDEETGEILQSNVLDIRLLKTIEYLTNLHDYVEIGMLKTDAPEIIRDSFKDISYETGEEEEIVVETLSALYTGQAMTITAIDRTEIDELQPSSGPAPPIEMFWQKTVMERVIRPIWEELSFSVGYLDKNIPAYYETSLPEFNQTTGIGGAYAAERSFSSSRGTDEPNLYKETFRKLKRISELLSRSSDVEDFTGEDLGGGFIVDDVAMDYFNLAKDLFDPIWVHLENYIFGGASLDEICDYTEEESGIELTSDQIIDAINYIGSYDVLEDIYSGARYVYKATQVANIANWEDADDLALKKAYEARNKIRQVIAELLVMPRDTVLTMPAGTPSGTVNFDSTLVIKQLITYSPEDDLDNGPERADVFPYGLHSVDIGGVAMRTLNTNGYGDGQLTDADSHFSHAPISNSVFAKNGTNFVHKTTPDDEVLEQVGDFLNKTSIVGVLDTLHDHFVGGCQTDLSEDCSQVTYKDFLYVAF